MRQYMAHTWPRAQNEFNVPCAIFSGYRYTCPACTMCCHAETNHLRSLRRSPQFADAGALTNYTTETNNKSSKYTAVWQPLRVYKLDMHMP